MGQRERKEKRASERVGGLVGREERKGKEGGTREGVRGRDAGKSWDYEKGGKEWR